MRIRVVTLLFFIVFSEFTLVAQENTERKVTVFLKKFQLDSVENNVYKMKESPAKNIFLQEIKYLKTGSNEQLFLLNDREKKSTNYDSIIGYNYIGDFYARKINPNDSLSFKNYLTALTLAKKRNDTLLINEGLRRINKYFLKNYTDKELYNNYVRELNLYKQDSIDFFWQKYYTLVYEMTYSSFSDTAFKQLEKRFLTLEKNTPSHSYFKGVINHMIGIFYSYPRQYKKSRIYFEKALKTYNNSEYYSFSRKIRTIIALSIIDFNDKKYQKSIKQLKKSLTNQYVKNNFELKYLIYDWISKSYEQLNTIDSSHHYLKLKNRAKDSVRYYEFAEKIRDINVKYDVTEKKKELKKLSIKNQSLQTQLLTLLPIFGVITLLLIVVYLLYKRYLKKSKKLKEEQSQTLQKLDELKKVVIKNHIVLKDKTKIYIADLLYIKSDDHYLNIFLSDGKNHFVRGKLNAITKELPPNFIRCHRSYIVNANFIKQVNSDTIILIDKTQIPLSRSYKDKF